MKIELAKVYDPKNVEAKWYRIWEEGGYFRTEVNPDKARYCIMMPPPNVTGVLHMGHGLQDTIQDALIRYYRMMGMESLWLPGTDHAGISTQNVVEKKLLKQGIKKENLGREKFLEEVWKHKEEHGDVISMQKRLLGDSADWSRERFTMDAQLSKAVRAAFVHLYKKGLIYRGDYIVNWCPRCRSAISDDEVNHQEHQGHLWWINYYLKGLPNQFIQVATTRPETMLGDTAVAVNPKDPRYKGLIGKTAILPVIKREIPIIGDSMVDLEFGTGAVKVTPAHDPNDYEISLRHGLPVVVVLDEEGRMTAEAGDEYVGMDRFECREALIEELNARKLLVKVTNHIHSVGHCYRCRTVIEPYLSRQWFVKMQPLAEPAIKAVRDGRIKFVPGRWAKVYFGWLENVRDWCISRQLWWGHRIPVWYCEDCGELTVEMEDPTECPKCGGELEQDPDVLDTWFSSWLWPFSTLGWPEDTAEMKYFYPTDVLVSGYDIIFFWIARMIIAGLEFTGDIPYRTVYITGMIRDEFGRWMSKSLGNGIDPIDMIEQYGADAVRYSLVALNTEGQDIKLAPSRFEMGRNFANKLWNAGRFLLMQGDLKGGAAAEMELADKWIVSRFQRISENAHLQIKKYRLNDALGAIYEFTWHEYCDWYVELIKARLYGKDEGGRERALQTARMIFGGILKLLHPFMPFITEELNRALLREAVDGELLIKSVYPVSEAEYLNGKAESEMSFIQQVIYQIRNLRAEMSVPLMKMAEVVLFGDAVKIALLERHLGYLTTLCKVDRILQGKEKPRPAVSAVLPGLEIFLPLGDLIDIDAERERLEKERSRVEGRLNGLRKKLSNQNFLQKAAPEVVEKEKNKLESAEQELAKIEANIELLE
ncbi:MAG: valine--tRNA ligase [candidate division Zixibacteria bacterium]|nr:valine--tRNA ligase [Candidatus Tariuqbacter arcticus]